MHHGLRAARAIGWRRMRLWLLAMLSCLLLVATPNLATPVAAAETIKAPVVLDGVMLFQVGSSANLTATERASIINQALQDEVRSPEPANVQVVQENQQIILRNRTSGRNLITVTQQDVTTGTGPISQATIWRRTIEGRLQRGKLERQPAYYRQALGFSLAILVGAIAGHLLLGLGGRLANRRLGHWLSHPASPLHPWEKPARLMVQLAVLGLQTGLWLAIALYISDLIPELRSWRYELFNFLTARIIILGESNYSALELLLLVALTIGLWFAVSGLTQLFRLYILERTGAERRVQDVVAVATQYTLTFLGLMVLLQIWGVDVRALAILASVLGVGIGFGVQNITNNLISGLIITLERPIQVGDFVQVAELVGSVERIGARSTEIRTMDQVTIIVPNSRFLETEVVNWSHGDPVSRLKIPVGVAYGSEVQRVQMALLEAAKSHPDVLLKPSPQVWFQEFGDSALQFELLVWTGEPKKQARVKSELYYRIEAALRRHEIEVPFQQRDVHLQSPQLDAFIAAWMARHEVASVPDAEMRYLFPASPNDAAADSLVPPADGDRLAAVDLTELVATLRQPGGLAIGDRRYRMSLYPVCFIGADLVQWLVEHRHYSREDALRLGQRLVSQGIIRHVLDEQPFRDGYVFYRFVSDEAGAEPG